MSVARLQSNHHRGLPSCHWNRPHNHWYHDNDENYYHDDVQDHVYNGIILNTIVCEYHHLDGDESNNHDPCLRSCFNWSHPHN